MAIGSLPDAKKAFNEKLTYLGKGCSRKAYRVGNVVYKVEHKYFGINRLEFDTVQELKELGMPFMPDMELYEFDGNTVLAMPFYDRVRDYHLVDEARSILANYFDTGDPKPLTWDMGGGNVAMDENQTLRIIDIQWKSDWESLTGETW